jgi:hypothetical protein
MGKFCLSPVNDGILSNAWKLVQALFMVLPSGSRNWKLVSVLLSGGVKSNDVIKIIFA